MLRSDLTISEEAMDYQLAIVGLAKSSADVLGYACEAE
jgi:hypothetical protein